MEVTEANFRCRVGHAWTADALLRASDQEIERALWTAIRSLEEKAKLSRRLAERTGRGLLGGRYTAAADEAEHAVSILTEYLAEAIPPAGGHLDE